jgi:hypothetical protein
MCQEKSGKPVLESEYFSTFFAGIMNDVFCNRLCPVCPMVVLMSAAGWPDWANFRPLGGCLLRAVFLKTTEVCSRHFWATFIHGSSYVLILQVNGLGYILGDFLSNSSGHPVCRMVGT